MDASNFETMTVEEAVEYCYKYRNEYVSESYECGENGDRLFDCLICILENGTITPAQLPEYGMDYTTVNK